MSRYPTIAAHVGSVVTLAVTRTMGLERRDKLRDQLTIVDRALRVAHARGVAPDDLAPAARMLAQRLDPLSRGLSDARADFADILWEIRAQRPAHLKRPAPTPKPERPGLILPVVQVRRAVLR